MAASSKGEQAHDLNCLTIKELEQHAAQIMDKQTRDYYNEVSPPRSLHQSTISEY